ncbi:SLATT domain-containing protein [Alcaligenes faecalis]|nr:SLATT domain-containing protein [Alcaligenes faecalis]
MPSPASQTPNMALDGQLREMYGRAAYTHKTHQKMADNYVTRYKRIKVAEIVLSAATASSLLIAIFGDERIGTIIGAILSAILLGFTLYFREASLGEQAQLHTEVGAKLWGVREALLSLLVDLQEGRPIDRVRDERDRLNAELEDIYKAAPRTNAKAYAAAQKALKDAEELFFSDEELDKMLPKQLRTKQKQP